MDFDVGSRIIFMKVGVHARESLDDIIERKAQEIDDAGFALWGYGGNTCHPRTMVQPFAEEAAEAGQPILLAMEPIESNHNAAPIRASEMSADGLTWDDIPAQINALGSRFALCIEELKETDLQVDLNETRVPLGRSKGRLGAEYVAGRVDKACLEVVPPEGAPRDSAVKRIGLRAQLTKPYAVFLR